MRYWVKILKREFGIKAKTIRVDFNKYFVLIKTVDSAPSLIYELYSDKVYSCDDLIALVFQLRRKAGESR